MKWLMALLMLAASAASPKAQSIRTYVSLIGSSDNNVCSRESPCKTLQGAHDKTLTNGEIIVLDPGGYGGLTITKAISVMNDGVGEASILVSGGLTGVVVNAAAGDAVNLRGLTIQGIGFGGGNGIRFNSGKSLTLENTIIRNLSGYGVGFFPTTSADLAMTGVLIADNASDGVLVVSGGASSWVRVMLNRVEVYGGGGNAVSISGGSSTGRLNVTATDSAAANNAGAGFIAFSTPSNSITDLMVARSSSSNNALGVSAQGGNATVRVSQSTVTGNVVSWSQANGGTLRSYGDNRFNGNQDGDPIPPGTPLSYLLCGGATNICTTDSGDRLLAQ